MLARILRRPQVQASRRNRPFRLRAAPLLIAALAILAWALVAAVAVGVAAALRGLLSGS